MNIRMSKDDPLYGIKENMIKSLGMTVEQEFRLMANGNGTVQLTCFALYAFN